MTFVLLAKVPDRGAAEVAEEALVDRHIEVELRRVSSVPYFATVSHESYEIRVPEQDLQKAQEVLRLVEHQSEEALSQQAAVAGDGVENAKVRRGDARRHLWFLLVLLTFAVLFVGSIFSGLVRLRSF